MNNMLELNLLPDKSKFNYTLRILCRIERNIFPATLILPTK